MVKTRGSRATLRTVELRVVVAELRPDSLRLKVVLQNLSDEVYGLASDLSGQDFRLGEDSGEESEPSFVDDGLDALGDEGTLSPGSIRSGYVVFPRPIGSMVELRVPGFPRLSISLDAVEKVDADFFPFGPVGVSFLEVEPFDEPRVDNLLEAQAVALEQRDFDGYLATFTAESQSREYGHFSQRLALPISRVEIEATEPPPTIKSGELEAEVRLFYWFEGIPEENAFVHTLLYSFREVDESWKVHSIRARDRKVLPWRRGPLAVHRTNHFLIYTEPAMERDLLEIARDAESAYARLYRQGLPMDSSYVIHFASGEDFTRTSSRPAAGIARVTFEQADGVLSARSRDFLVNGSYFSTSNRRRISSERRLVTVTHELAHLAMMSGSVFFMPPWLVEGAAVYFSGDLNFDDNRRLLLRGLEHLNLEEMTDAKFLGEHGRVSSQVSDEYRFSGSVVAYLVELGGVEGFLAFCRSFSNEVPEAVGGSRESMDSRLTKARNEATEAALGEHYELTVAELGTAVKEWFTLKHR